MKRVSFEFCLLGRGTRSGLHLQVALHQDSGPHNHDAGRECSPTQGWPAKPGSFCDVDGVFINNDCRGRGRQRNNVAAFAATREVVQHLGALRVG